MMTKPGYKHGIKAGGKHTARTREPRPVRPLDAAALQALALHYAARYATTAARLHSYLLRKLKARGWEGEDAPDPKALVARIEALGYVNDRAFAAARARDLTARGLGSRRVRAALAGACVSREDVAATLEPGPDAADGAADGAAADGAAADTNDTGADPAALRRETAIATAVAFARRRRLGPFARDGGAAADHVRQRREMAAMLRGGHDLDIARRVLRAPDTEAAEAIGRE